jgi:hypothetical protein
MIKSDKVLSSIDRIVKAIQDIVMATIEDAKGIKRLIKERDWVTLIILFLLIGCPAVFAFWLGSQNSNHEVADDIEINSFTGNYAESNTAPVNQTFVTQEYEPSIEYSVISNPEKQADGYYHTTYEILFIDGSNEDASVNFHYSTDVFANCLGTSNPRIRIRGRSALINDIECISKKIPPNPKDEKLFWY